MTTMWDTHVTSILRSVGTGWAAPAQRHALWKGGVSFHTAARRIARGLV